MKKLLIHFICVSFGMLLLAGNVKAQNPKIAAKGNTTFCEGGNVTLVVISDTLKKSIYQWKLDGNAISGATDTPYIATQAGNYSVVAISGKDTTFSNEINIIIHQNPVASFTFDNTINCSSVPKSFTNNSGGGLSYNWNFGDNNSGGNNTTSTQNPTHTFIGGVGNSNQSFNVSLTVKDGNGCTNSTTQTVQTKQLPDPTVKNLTQFPFINCDGKNFNLVLKNKSTTNNSTYSIHWDDGNPDSTFSTFPANGITHNYSTQGYFNFQIFVTGNNGCVNSENHTVYNGSNPQVPFSNPGTSSNKCVPFPFTVPTTSTLNSPGTIYIFSKNDGTPDDTIKANPPPDYYHAFNNGSCGALGTNGLISNAFHIYITATNACPTPSYTDIGPITTLKKPTSSFSVSNLNICVNSSVSATDNSLSGVTSITGSTCDISAASNWQVSPNSGWVLKTGLLGNSSPDLYDNSTWGSKSLSLQFSQVGIFTITLIVRNSCGNDTMTKTICVTNTPPVPTFDISNSNGCVPFSVNLINTSSASSCATNGATWNITKSSLNNCTKDSTSDFDYISGTNNSSNNPVLQLKNQGVYNVVLSVNGCKGPQITSKTITANRKPQLSNINISSNACTGIPITPSVTAIGCGDNNLSYNWSFQGGSPSSSNAASPGNVTFNTVGSSTVKLDASNSCGTTTTSQTVVVSQAPTITDMPDIIVCSGGPTTIPAFTSSIAGTSFSWTNSNTAIGLAASGTGNISSFTAINTESAPITATIKVTPKSTNGGCSGIPKTFVITVKKTPNLPIVTTPIINTCQFSTNASLTVTPDANNTLNWYTVSSGGTGSAVTPSINSNAVGTQHFYVSQNNAYCESGRMDITVIISPSPKIEISKIDSPKACQQASGSIAISGLTTGASYTINYTKDGIPATQLKLLANNGTITIGSLKSGTYDHITATQGTCPSNVLGPITLSDPNPPATPTVTYNNIILCSGSPLTLSASSTTPNVSYSWSGPINFNNNNSANPTIPNIQTNGIGTYSVTASLNGCISGAGIVTVVVNQTPSTPTITGSTTICSGSPINLTASTAPLGNSSFSWILPDGSINNTNNISIPSSTSSNAGNYKVKATLGDCISQEKIFTVVVNTTPNITGSSSVIPSNCATASGGILLNGLLPSTSYQANYNGSNKSLTTDISGTLTIPQLGAATYNAISVTSLAGCKSNEVGPITIVDPTPPVTPTASGVSQICSGQTLNLVGNSAVTGVNYSWKGPNSFTSTAQNPSIPQIITAGTGTYEFVVILMGCKSEPATVSVVVDSTPAKPTISPIVPLCSGNSLHLTASTPSTGNLSYLWNGPNSFICYQNDTTLNKVNELAAGAYNVSVKNSNGGCVSETTSLSVTVRPALTQAIINQDSIRVCNYNPKTMAGQAVSANLDGTRPYEKGKWSVVNKPLNSSTNFTNDTLAATNFNFNKSGVYFLQWEIGNDVGCTSTKDTVILTVIDKPTIATPNLNTRSVNVCASNPVTISINDSDYFGQIKYWQIKRPHNATSWKDTTVQSSTITFNNVQDSFIVRLVVISKDTLDCSLDSAFRDLQINVAPPSNAGTAVGLNTVCQGINSGTITLSGNTGSPTWQSSLDSLVFSDVAKSAGLQFTYSNLTKTTWFRSAVKSGSCDTVFSNTIKITVVPPVTISVAGADKSLCADSVYHLEANNPTSIETGTWTFSSSDTGRIDNIHDPNSFVRGLKANTIYKLVWTIDNHICNVSSSTVIITNLNPLTNTIDTTTNTYCNSASITIGASPAIGGNNIYQYQWEVKRGNSWYALPNENKFDYSFKADTTVVLHRLVIAGPCTSTSLEKSVYVQPPLGNNFIQGNGAACINTPIGLLKGSSPTGADGSFIYLWQQTDDTLTNSWKDIPLTNSKDYTAPIVTNTIFYRRIVTSQLCAGNQSNTSPVYVVLMRPDAKADWLISRDTACAPFLIDDNAVQPILHNDKNSSYNWYAHDSLYGNSGVINPGFTLVPAGDSVQIKMVAVSKYVCKNDSLIHSFVTPSSPKTSFTVSDSSNCGPLADTVLNKTALISLFQYNWDFGFGYTSNLQQPGVVVFPPNPLNKDTIYLVKLTAFNQCDTVTTVKHIKVRSRAKAIFAPSKTFGCSPLTDVFLNLSRGDSSSYVWEFGDSNRITSKDSLPVTHTYHTGTQDTFDVKLIAQNYCGNDTAHFAIVVAASTIQLQVIVNGNELNSCSKSDVHFVNATKGASTINWDFGDGSLFTSIGKASNLDTVVHQFDTIGTFNVTIHASNNCTDTTGFSVIKVLSVPKASFMLSPDTVCIGHPIYFKNTSDATTSLKWLFGDTTQSVLTNPVHDYKNAGNYDVQLIAERQHISANICRDTAIRQVTILSSLPGYIQVTDSVSKCVPFTVTFNNGFAASTKLCKWDFGDGTTNPSTGNHVTHTYTKVGVYQVVMSAIDTGGCTYIGTKQITVNGPAGNFTYDHDTICGKVAVKFEANVTGTDSIKWNFGNGVSFITTEKNLSYLYPQSGNFVPDATLIAGEKGSCKVKLAGIDTITIDKVLADFSLKAKKVCDTTTVSFVDASSAYLGLVSWNWQFGDKTTSTEENPVHLYLETNTWPLQLIVKSTSGCTDTAYRQTIIKVNNTPQVDILADSTGCATQAVVYDAIVTSIDPGTYFNWVFSNGYVSNTPNVNAYFAQAGNYSVTLIMGTAYGCYDTATASVKIYPTPQVVTNPDFQLCLGQSNFINTLGATTYQWTPSAGLSCNNCPNPIANPTTTTRYVVAGYNNFGCAGRDTLLITVIPPFVMTTSGNDTMCLGDQPKQLAAFGATNYNWSPSTGLNTTKIATPLANPELTTHYRVIGTDNYHCFADTSYLVVAVGTYPQVNLGQNQVLSTGTVYPIHPVFTFPTETAGPINKYIWSPSVDLSCDDCPNPLATVEHDVCYTLTATNIYGCSANVDTLCIKAFCKNTQVYIANTFTPDNDGINDKLVVQGKGIRVINSFRIFNRWGQIVFERTNFQPNDVSFGWDGKVKGIPASPDVYVYTCEVVCENEVPFTYKGNISVLK